jgi:hypothetical protein
VVGRGLYFGYRCLGTQSHVCDGKFSCIHGTLQICNHLRYLSKINPAQKQNEVRPGFPAFLGTATGDIHTLAPCVPSLDAADLRSACCRLH